MNIGPYFRRTERHVAVLRTIGKPHIRFNGRSITGFGTDAPLWEAAVAAETPHGTSLIYGKGRSPVAALRELLQTTGGR